MPDKKSPKPLFLLRGIFLSIVALFLISALAGCSSTEPMTRKVGLDLEANRENTNQLEGFRFYLSTDVMLEGFDHRVDTYRRQTTVRERTETSQITISEKTPGRLQSGDVHTELHVAFERRGGTMPTIAFRQNEGAGDYDRFYFTMQIDEDSGAKYINYNGEKYTVIYMGDSPPYLLYKRTESERTTSRRMRGLR